MIRNKDRWQLRSASLIFIVGMIMLLPSCTITPEALDFGKDVCSYCSMTTIDKKFGAEIINSKGKSLKFDCGECMLKYLKAHSEFKPAKFFIISYDNPGNLVEAEKAFYLSGGNVDSPMGGKLAAFTTREAAEKFQKDLHGDIILWGQVTKLNF